MAQAHDLSGVWYDAADGDFCRLQRDGDTVKFYTPDMEDCYHEMPEEDFNTADLYRVDEQAVEDPSGYYQDFLASVLDDMHCPVEFMYADRHTEVVEVSDD